MSQSTVVLSVVLVLLLLVQVHWCGGDPLVAPVCGKHIPSGIGNRDLAIEGQAKYGEFPWMVSVFKKENLFGVTIKFYHCGGSLIHPKVVLTAAEAVDYLSPDRLMSRAGEWIGGNNSETFPYQDRNVSEVVLHPEYSREGLHNDIALLFLESPVLLEEGIQTVCLPPPEATFDLQRCLVSGWGAEGFGQPREPLKKGELSIVPADECQSIIRTIIVAPTLGIKFDLHSSFICAGGVDDRMPVWAGRGSPLVCPIQGSADQQFQQVGIAAWITSSTKKHVPSGYASLAIARRWIDQVMLEKALDIGSYDSQRDRKITLRKMRLKFSLPIGSYGWLKLKIGFYPNSLNGHTNFTNQS